MEQIPVSSAVLQSLHRICRQLHALRERLTLGPQIAAVFQKKIAEGTARLQACQEELKKTQLHASELQMQLGTREERLRTRRTQLLEAKNNADYQALKDQIAADEAATGVLELETIEAMEKIDQQKLVVREAEETLEKRMAETRKHSEQYATDAPKMRDEITRLESEFQHEDAKLSGEFRSEYQRLVRSKGVDSFAPLDGRSCTGCHTQITLQMYSEIVSGQIRLCRACGRVLYLPDDFQHESLLREAKRS